MKFFTKEVKIALIALVGIVVLFYGLQFLKGLNVFSSDSSYYVAFDDVSGLSSSSPVYANGYRVGVVKSLSYDYNPQGKIIAELGLDNNMRVPQGSHAELASDLLGNIKINLVLSDDPIHMLSKGDTISGKTGNLNATSAELKTLSASLNREMPAMMQKTNGVLDNTQQLTGNLAAIDIAEMTEKVNKTLANVEQMTQKLNSNEGTLGLLMRDATLYHNLSSTAASADSLLIDLKEHPKRYVHFSIFGRKDN